LFAEIEESAMAQEFRTFSQTFNNQTFQVQAKTIVDGFGRDVVSANGQKIWFPLDFDPAAAIGFGKSIVAVATNDLGQTAGNILFSGLDLIDAVQAGGRWDLQRSYNGVVNGPFAEVFTPAASYTFGLIGAAAGYPEVLLQAGGGLYNLRNIYDRPDGRHIFWQQSE
jgi:hypothetical protein